MADDIDLALSAGDEAIEPDAELKDAQGSSGKTYTEEELAEILAENRELQAYKEFEPFADLIKEMKAQGHNSGEDFKTAAWNANLNAQIENLEQLHNQTDNAAAVEYRERERREGWRDQDGSPEQMAAMNAYLAKINQSQTAYQKAKEQINAQKAARQQAANRQGPVPEATINALMKQYPLASRKTLSRIAQTSTAADLAIAAQEMQETSEASIERAKQKSAQSKAKPAPEGSGATPAPKKDGEFPYGPPPNALKDP
jgi:hypothetical protein